MLFVKSISSTISVNHTSSHILSLNSPLNTSPLFKSAYNVHYLQIFDAADCFAEQKGKAKVIVLLQKCGDFSGFPPQAAKLHEFYHKSDNEQLFKKYIF